MKKNIILFAAIISLAACASPNTMSPVGTKEEISSESQKQQELAFKQALKEEAHVHKISYPILKNNASLCTENDFHTGMMLWNSQSLPKEFRKVALDSYAVDDFLRVKDVYPNSPAKKAGVLKGDVILAVNDVDIPQGKSAFKVIEKALDSSSDAKVNILLNRKGKEKNVIINRTSICNYGVVYDPFDSTVNAYADGDNIYFSRGMYRFVNSDKEMALVLAHEVAHNAMGHMDKKAQNAMAGAAGGLFVDILFAAAGVNTGGAFADSGGKIGANTYSVEFEQEADYVGMYFLTRAGYSASGAENFWRRMAAENNMASIKSRTTHPTAPERFLAINKTYQEIENKKSKGQKLVPELAPEVKTNSRVKVKSAYN